MKENPIIHFCDYELLQLLTELEKINFFQTLVIVIQFADTEVDLKECKCICRRMREINEEWKALCRIESTYQLHEVEEHDKIFADLPRRRWTEELKSVNHFNEKSMKLHLKCQAEEQRIPLSEKVIEVMSKIAVEANNKRKGV